MSTATLTRSSRTHRLDQAAGALLVLGGVTFVAGGITHPGDSGEGSKVSQLHEMLVDSMWYPSHALMLASFVCIAGAIVGVRMRIDLGAGMTRLLNVVATVAVVATVGMVFHLIAATNAEAIADGEKNVMYHVQEVVETGGDTLWGLAIVALALAGGLTRTLGNRLTIAFGVVGGLAFSLASATIAFTDRFDPLFPVGSLIGIWAVAVGLMTIGRKASGSATPETRA